MLDIRFIRENPEVVAKICQQRKVKVDLEKLLQLDQQRATLRQQLEDAQRERRQLAEQAHRDRAATAIIDQGRQLKKRIAELEGTLAQTEPEFEHLLLAVPNIPSEDTPIGESDADNRILRQVGSPRKFNFEPKPHWVLGKLLDVIDNERAAKVSGSRFTYLKGELVLMQFALLQLAYSIVTSQEKLGEIITRHHLDLRATPFTPILPPVMITPDAFQKMARLEPKEDRYHIPSDDVYLVGSAEHTLGAMHMDEIIPADQLPLRYAGFSPAFRREAGSHGRDVRGILRLHQFDKLEGEVFSTPETSIMEQNLLVAIQEHFMQLLHIPYQVILICTGEMGGPDARQIDLESWMPGQGRYRETHTADLMTDYQAKRLQTRLKKKTGKKEFVHMNDATLFAMGRTLAAIMENYQQEDGSITVPAALQPYLPFTHIAVKRYT